MVKVFNVGQILASQYLTNTLVKSQSKVSYRLAFWDIHEWLVNEANL